MSPIEHYFENLLTMDSDIKGEPNKNALSKEVQEAIEICADYIKNIQYSNVISDDINAEKVAMLKKLQTEIEGIEKPLCHSATHAKGCVDKWKVEGLIQQKIEQLKGEK